MRRAEDMRKLAEDIINSFDTRDATRVPRRQEVVALKQEIATMLHGFRQELKPVQMDLRRKAADLKRFLGNAAASRMSDFRAYLEAIKARQKERNREVAGMIGDFRRDREAAASHWQNMAATMLKRRAGVTR